MDEFIFDYLKGNKKNLSTLGDKAISSLNSLSKKYHLIGFIASIYKLDKKTEFQELNSVRNTTIAKNLMMMHDLKSICLAFNKKKINYCILKGAALNIANVYNPAIRFFRDLDILVAKEELEPAFKILNHLGYKYRNKFTKNSCEFLGDQHHLPVMLNENGTFIELHHRVTSVKHFKECPISKKILKEKIFHKKIFIPSPEALIAHAIYHGLVQHRSSIGPIILFDIKEIMKKYSLNEQNNNEYLALLKLEEEFIKINEFLLDILNTDEIKDFNQRLNNISQNLDLAETEGNKIHILDFRAILKIFFNNFFYKKIISTELEYQTSRSSLIFPLFYINELLISMRNIRLF